MDRKVSRHSAGEREAISPAAVLLPGGLRPKRIDTGAIFETLRYRISILEYPPGTALKEIALSEEFGVSRTPIRQALQRLEVAGLVQPVIGHGTIVMSIDLQSMRHLLQYRLHLALMLENFLSTVDSERTIEKLTRCYAMNAALEGEFSPQAYAQISHDLRWVICNKITNPFLAQSWIETYYLASRIWFLCLPAHKNHFISLQAEEITGLIESFGSGEPGRVATTVHDALQTAVSVVWQSVASGDLSISIS
ncbi:GntR family transcriptional regulator [Mesorhizobium amorphae]|uniref:GntR family transcriptional regulator n=1 Tax=Mesorhizobium amorphae TaxID=71433 RepID=UPI000A498F47|nr:GntR family transcriptional regulator [Mesorhizobium amorphae]